MSRSTTKGSEVGNLYRPMTSVSLSRGVRSRPRTAATSTGYGYYSGHEIICAVSESRGFAPTVGIAFVNLTTCEAALCQFTDTQTYARAFHKIQVFCPTEVVFASSAAESKLVSVLRENLNVEDDEIRMTAIDRRYWSENAGHDYLKRLAPEDDFESLKLATSGNFFAVCCLSAALKYTDLVLGQAFVPNTLRVRFETSEGALMIDPYTTASLELVQNLQDAKSRNCLFGLLRQNLTVMGTRLLRNNILQPSLDTEKLERRFDVVQELTSNEEMFSELRDLLKDFIDTDRTISNLVLVQKHVDFQRMEQSVNNILMLKSFIDGIKPVWQVLSGAQSPELQRIRQLCDYQNYGQIQGLIDYAINSDVGYAKKAIDLRAHRVYAIKAGANGFLDVARKSYNEFISDAAVLVDSLQEENKIKLELKFDTTRQYFIKIAHSDVKDIEDLPNIFINALQNRRGKCIECQTLELVKINQKIKDAHNEVIGLADRSIQELINSVRLHIQPLFKISEAIALLDMLLGFAQVVVNNPPDQSYVRPEFIKDTLALLGARHPITEVIHHQNQFSSTRFIPNDVFATPQKRFQIMTGCNMSGKSTYIRTIALLTVMAHVGCFIPSTYACFPVVSRMFARVSTDDSIEANVSTFASEMREMAFILRNIEGLDETDVNRLNGSTTYTHTTMKSQNKSQTQSLIIIDELGRGTSTTDGLSIAVAIAEALVQSRAFVFFVTHFRDLPHILAERAGVVNLHMSVEMTRDFSTVKMKYKVSPGAETQKFYGLALAQVLDLPRSMMDTAVMVAKTLNERSKNKKKGAEIEELKTIRTRRLVLEFREAIEQARYSLLSDGDLKKHLSHLRDDFVNNMSTIKNISIDDGQDEQMPEQGTEVDMIGAEDRDIPRPRSNTGRPLSKRSMLPPSRGRDMQHEQICHSTATMKVRDVKQEQTMAPNPAHLSHWGVRNEKGDGIDPIYIDSDISSGTVDSSAWPTS